MYRPISLTDPIARVMERIVCSDIRTLLHCRFNLHQHGFINRRSCQSSLISTVSRYKALIKAHKTLDIVYFDFAKAFDKVDHHLLLGKLSSFGVPSLYTQWFSDFLSFRTFSVKVNDYTDNTKIPIPSGVPQGTVSGPLLFIIFINDLLNGLNDLIDFTAFADDVKVFSPSPLIVQSAIDFIADWALNNKLPLAHSKTSLLHLGPFNPRYNYNIAGTKIS
uniref:Reverse transcriptase domain-containing protein n=1 Tax=Caenorhabditis japonica TaxID=281687 RepID=A0A8R1IES8_CAEJA